MCQNFSRHNYPYVMSKGVLKSSLIVGFIFDSNIDAWFNIHTAFM